MSKRQNHYGLERVQNLGENVTAKKTIELPCVRLNFDKPQSVAIYCGDDSTRNPSHHYYKASFGSENCQHSCNLAPGLNIVFGDFIEVTAINLYFNITHGSIWENVECFAILCETAPSWIEE